jgi:hypothetical protein
MPSILNPVPVTDPALRVRGAEPDDVIVTLCVAGVFNATAPKPTVVELNVSAGATAFKVSPNDFFTPIAAAVSVAVWVLRTAGTVTANFAIADPAETLTDAGTFATPSSLHNLTANPFAPAAAVSDTEQLSLPAPVSELLAQVN